MKKIAVFLIILFTASVYAKKPGAEKCLLAHIYQNKPSLYLIHIEILPGYYVIKLDRHGKEIKCEVR